MGCDDKCTMKIDEMPLKDFPPAMAYVPWQSWGDLYDLDDSFCIGTIFKDLNKPFLCYK